MRVFSYVLRRTGDGMSTLRRYAKGTATGRGEVDMRKHTSWIRSRVGLAAEVGDERGKANRIIQGDRVEATVFGITPHDEGGKKNDKKLVDDFAPRCVSLVGHYR
jgi:hypothetical protein